MPALLLSLLLPLPFCGCAHRLRAAMAAGEPSQAAPGVTVAAPRSDPAPTRLVLSAEQLLPPWLGEAAQLFEQMTAIPVELPSASAMESVTSASSDTPPTAGDVRWVDAAEARALGKSGAIAALPSEVATTLATGLTEQSFKAFEETGRHWGVPLAASWLGLIVDPDALPAGERGAPPHLDDWLAQLKRVRAAAASGRAPAAPLWVAWDEPGSADTFALLVAAMGGRLFNDRGLPAFADEGDTGARALALMARLLGEGFVQKNALETHAADLPAALGNGHAYWISWSDTLETRLAAEDRRPLLRRLGQVQPAAFPMDAKVYSYEMRPAVLLVRYQGLAVSAASRGAGAWKLARFVAHPLLLDATSQLTTVLRTPAPPSGAFAAQSRALLTKERQMAAWELTPDDRRTLGRFVQAALKKTLTPEEALTKAARALGAPAPPPTAATPTGLAPPLSTPTVSGIPPAPSQAPTTAIPAPGSTSPITTPGAQPTRTGGPALSPGGASVPRPGSTGAAPNGAAGTGPRPPPPP